MLRVRVVQPHHSESAAMRRSNRMAIQEMVSGQAPCKGVLCAAGNEWRYSLVGERPGLSGCDIAGRMVQWREHGHGAARLGKMP